MSIAVSNFYWDRYAGVKDGERLVILALAHYCNDSGWCFPSVAELSRRCQLSDRGTQKILARLAAGGHIAVEANAGVRKTRGSPTHKYHLLAYQRSLTGAQDEQLRSPLAVDKDERIDSPPAVDKDERIDSPLGAEKGEQIARKGEQIARKGEQVGSPDSDRSTNDPNTNNAPRARRAAPPAQSPGYQKVVKAYHDEIGTLTAIVEEEIKDELTRSSPEWVVRAIEVAAMRSHRRWAYIAGILRRWHADGYDGGPHKQDGKTGSNTGSKSMGYGRQGAPAMRAKGQSIEDYADDPEYYGQLKALYAGGAAGAAAERLRLQVRPDRSAPRGEQAAVGGRAHRAVCGGAAPLL